MLAIIGGTGMTNLASLEITRREVVRTPYGEPSGHLTFGHIGSAEMMFLARHGYAHTLPPHEVNYRANIWALHKAGATRIVAVNAVGGIAANMGPGALALPDQIIDYTHSRKQTFFEGEEPVTHVDFTFPFCARARALVLAASAATGQQVHDGGVLGVMQGPRLETRAEIIHVDGRQFTAQQPRADRLEVNIKMVPRPCLDLVIVAERGAAGIRHGHPDARIFFFLSYWLIHLFGIDLT